MLHFFSFSRTLNGPVSERQILIGRVILGHRSQRSLLRAKCLSFTSPLLRFVTIFENHPTSRGGICLLANDRRTDKSV